LLIQNCSKTQTYQIRLAEGEPFPNEAQLNNIFDFGGDTALENECWRLIGFTTDCSNVNFSDVTIEEDYECAYCSVCYPVYRITECDSLDKNLQWILWDPNATPLVEDGSYLFDIPGYDPDVCYKVNLDYRLCIETFDFYDESNIIDSFTDCAECNEICYKITDCITGESLRLSNAYDWSIYANQILSWYDPKYPETIFCGLIESYLCRSENISATEIILVDCHDTCIDCYPTDPEDPEFIEPSGRFIKPGYKVPSCQSGSLNINSKDCCNE
jgi:hypothetical protein